MERYIQKTIVENSVILSLNRPEKGNALNLELIRELSVLVKEIEDDDKIRFVTLKTNSKHFCVGADLVWMASSSKLTEENNFSESLELAELFEGIFFSNKIYLAIVKGACYGGGVGLAAACDFIFAEKSASFAFSEVKLGLIPATISPFIVHRIGFKEARNQMLLGKTISAGKALEMRLIDEIFDIGSETDLIEKYRKMLLKGGPLAQQGIKKLLNSWSLQDYNQKLKNQTAEIIAKARVSEEGKEGIRAFLEKRKADWSL